MELRHEAARGWTALTGDVAEQVAAMTSPASPHRKGSLESQEQSLGAQRRLRGALCPVTRWTHRRTLRRDMSPQGPRENRLRTGPGHFPVATRGCGSVPPTCVPESHTEAPGGCAGWDAGPQKTHLLPDPQNLRIRGYLEKQSSRCYQRRI